MELLRVPHQQLVVGSTAPTITARLLDGDGDEASGLTVTVDVARADGTSLHAGLTTTEGTDELAGNYTATLVDADVAQLDLLTATWKVGGAVKATTITEICGGFYFTPREIRVKHPTLTAQKVDDAALKELRSEVESEFERITRAAFVPRYARVRVSTAGRHSFNGDDWSGNSRYQLIVPHMQLRTVRTLRIYSDATNYTTLDTSILDVDESGVITRLDHGFWPYANGIVVEYEYGYDEPPRGIVTAGMLRLRELANQPTGAIPSRAQTFQVAEGGTYRLATADADSTGNPDIDAALERYSNRGIALGMA